MNGWNIAQLNVGRTVASLEDPVMAGFMRHLDEINVLAERSPGFIWRLQGDNGNNTTLKITDDPRFIVNLSVWSSVDELFAFTYRSGHRELFARRYDWFERFGSPSVCLWWIPEGELPSIEDALERLDHLQAHGPTTRAFTFKDRFMPSPPGVIDAAR